MDIFDESYHVSIHNEIYDMISLFYVLNAVLISCHVLFVLVTFQKDYSIIYN